MERDYVLQTPIPLIQIVVTDLYISMIYIFLGYSDRL